MMRPKSHARRKALLSLLALAACRGGPSDEAAVGQVRAYNQKVIEAFRTGDARVVEPVTGPTDGRRITGLIGVKLDAGLTLDARLLELKPVGVERRSNEVVVVTEERWSYVHRRLGTGEEVGPYSNDHYFMRYHLRRQEGRWVVDEIAFAKPPEVVPADRGEGR